MIEKTDALVLRITPFSRTSHIVTWLSRGGKLTTAVKGACRPKSAFLGQYDLFYTCELLYYARQRDNIHIAKECTPLNTRSALRTDWRAASCASYACDLVARISLVGRHDADLYGLTTTAVDALCALGAKPAFIFWFELRLMKLLGLSPQLTHCCGCGRGLSHAHTSMFSPDRGGLLCSGCAPSSPGTGAPLHRASPDVIRMLHAWLNADSPRAPSNTACSRDQVLAFRSLLGDFLLYHLDIRPRSRNIAIDLVCHGTNLRGL